MGLRGQYKYAPREVIEKLENYKLKYNVGDAEAFRRIVADCEVGSRMRDIDKSIFKWRK